MSWEVRIMQSARSWFNVTLFRKNLTRFWPIWGLYLVIWLFLFPIALFLNNYSLVRFAHEYVLEDIISVGLPLAVVFSLLAACAVWSYLCNNRATCLAHSLPVRREGLFLTNYLSGLTFLVGPNLTVFVLTLLAEAAQGVVDAGSLVMWLVSVSLMELFFFSFATFCAMFTGHILGLPAFYAILNVLAAGLAWLLDLTLSRFVFGYTGVKGLWKAAEWLTPAWKLADNLEVRYQVVNGAAVVESSWLSGLGYILIYVIFGLILAALALAVYRRRDMERAGDVVTVSWVRPIFQYGVAFCCALAFGTLLYEIFRSALPEGAWTLLLFLLICGAAGYFLARMLLEKSFRVFHCWKGCVPFLAALVVLVCVMELDLTGFERRIPAEQEVASVRIDGVSSRPYDAGSGGLIESTDPQVIQAALAAHQAIVDHKQDLEDGVAADNSGPLSFTGFYVEYRLENGKTVSRDYGYMIPVTEQNLADPDSPAAKLEELINLPQVIEQSYGLSGQSPGAIIDLYLSGYLLSEEFETYSETGIDPAYYEDVFQAVLADLEEGGLGRRYLADDQERMGNCMVNDLSFTFYRGAEAGPGAADTAEGTTVPADGGTTTVTITLQTTARHTLEVLRRPGVLEGEITLRTQEQMEQASLQFYESGESWENVNVDVYAWEVLGGAAR